METTSHQTTPSPEDRQTFVIGDVHGHLDRLEALLDKAGVNVRHEVIQLGDLGHYGITGSPRGDADTWAFAQHNIHTVLWGNHDYAVMNSAHMFGGYAEPFYETIDMIKLFMAQDRLKMAAVSHGFLLTHAGLAKAFRGKHVDPAIKADPERFVDWVDDCMTEQHPPEAFYGVRDAISVYRDGRANAGGILWRDAREKLYPNFRQIFGHTAKDGKVRKYRADQGWSYCIDIGTATNGRLAGIWLPSEEIIDIKVDSAVG